MDLKGRAGAALEPPALNTNPLFEVQLERKSGAQVVGLFRRGGREYRLQFTPQLVSPSPNNGVYENETADVFYLGVCLRVVS